MNITDVQTPDAPASFADAIRAIFVRQRELMDKYQQIEQLPKPPISVHHANGQKILKDFAWRVAEELAESAEAFDKHPDSEHGFEEIADALHFLVELLIFAGVSVEQCLERTPAHPLLFSKKLSNESTLLLYWRAVYAIGIAMNFLRCKPWKQSQVPTDEARLRAQLLEAWDSLLKLWAGRGIDWVDMHAFYFRKSEVNKFRIRSQY